MAELSYGLRAERKDNYDGKTIFGLFLLLSFTKIYKNWLTYDGETV